jgi:REP element-mobilizing transposase RayT
MPLYNKYPRLPAANYIGRRLTLVTICCAARRPVFADIETGRWTLTRLIHVAAQHSFSLHSYCLMPDHLHFIVEGMTDSCDLLKLIHGFKQRTAHVIHSVGFAMQQLGFRLLNDISWVKPNPGPSRAFCSMNPPPRALRKLI